MANLIVYDEAPVLLTDEAIELLRARYPDWQILTFKEPEPVPEILGIDYGAPGEDRAVITRGYFDEDGVLVVTDVEEI